jgi:hypothetical protein
MAISFLDLVPKPPTAVVTIDTLAHGPQEIELTGVSLRELGDIAKRFPEFQKVLEGGGGSTLDHPEAVSAMIAASLGHPGDTAYEAHIVKFPHGEIVRIATTVVTLTFTRYDADPLSPAVNGAGGDALAQNSPAPSNS